MRSKNRKRRGSDYGCVFIEDTGGSTILCYGPRKEADEAKLDANGGKATLRLPGQRFRLEEVNLPANLVRSLAGRNVAVQVLPEEQAGTRRISPGTESSAWIDPQGNCWNDYQPLRVLLTGPDGKVWRLPRSWLEPAIGELSPAVPDGIERASIWREELHLPTELDLQEINIAAADIALAAGRPAAIEVHAAPGKPVKVFWRDSGGVTWRIPHNWRRRRIRLPSSQVLVSQDVPSTVAQDYAGKIVSVNYHPGSLCCLPDGYRFRDREGNRWPVKKRDCVLIGYGDGEPCALQ